MNKNDRMRAFSLRCDGCTWDEISKVLGYESSTIARDIHSVIEKGVHTPQIIYPKLLAFVLMKCDGSIENFARQLGVHPHRLRRVLVYGDQPSERMINIVTEYTKLKGAFDI